MTTPKVKHMKILYRALCVVLSLFLLSGCLTTSKDEQQPQVSNQSAQDNVKQKLLSQHQTWQGTPYKLGGRSKQGVDCSGFIQLTFLEKLGTEIPRTTLLQSKTGKKVDLEQIRIGDLVFFKTGHKVRHVGVYVGDGQFLHASKSKGVMLSKLDNPYWADSFWMARRVF